MNTKRLPTVAAVWMVLVGAAAPDRAAGADDGTIVLRNTHVLRELRLADGAWRTVLFARADGSDELKVHSDEFHVLPVDAKAGFTVGDYAATGKPVRTEAKGVTTVRIAYRPRKALPKAAPTAVVVTYTLGPGPYMRKTVTLTLAEGQAVDRLQVERFHPVGYH